VHVLDPKDLDPIDLNYAYMCKITSDEEREKNQRFQDVTQAHEVLVRTGVSRPRSYCGSFCPADIDLNWILNHWKSTDPAYHYKGFLRGREGWRNSQIFPIPVFRDLMKTVDDITSAVLGWSPDEDGLTPEATAGKRTQFDKVANEIFGSFQRFTFYQDWKDYPAKVEGREPEPNPIRCRLVPKSKPLIEGAKSSVIPQ